MRRLLRVAAPLVGVGLLVTASGCSSAEAGSAAESASVAAPFEAYSINVPGDNADRTTEQTMMTTAAAAAVISPGDDLSPLMRPGTTLAESEAAAETALASAHTLDSTGQSVLRQMVASVMVQRHLDAEDPDLDAVGRYTQMLLDDESPNAHLLVRALPALESTWGETRVAAAAEKGRTDATLWLDQTCPACNASALRSGQTDMAQDAASGTRDTQRAIQQGIESLAIL